MAKSKKPKPFDVSLTKEQRDQLATDLCREVQDALSARSSMIADGGLIDYYDWLYEQGQSDKRDLPFPGAADLTSYLITQDVDAMRSRLMKAIFGVRPFAFVEGRGADAAKAPYVEAFHDWQIRKSELKLELAKTIHGALIEDGYILEVSDKIETRKITQTVNAALDVSTGGPVFESGQPKLKVDEFGDPVPAQEGEAAAQVERTQIVTRRLGPQYDAISLKDFVFLPGHVKSMKQVWGHAYRIWKRLPELQEQVADGIYDADAVTLLGDSSDRQLASTPAPVDTVAAQEGPSVEKELFQVSLKRDLDGDGREEWYVATISLPHQALLRLKLDLFAMKINKSRCVPFILFPRRDSIYGYSYAGKEVTIAEEHTSLRNMKADRQNLATNAPMTRLQTALWDPDAQPIGVGRVIDVRDHNEVKPFVVQDVPSSVIQSEMVIHQANERVSGLSDNFVGLLAQQERTLGENKLAAGGSSVRVDEVVGHLHAALATVLEISHAIWIETAEADPRGVEAPASLVTTLKNRGLDLQSGRFTLSQLKGDFAFEPYGSDRTANPEQQLSQFNAGMEALANLAKVFPGLQGIFQSPDLAQTILEQWARVYDVRDIQPFMNALQLARNAAQAAPAGLPAAPGALPAPGGPQPPAPSGVPVGPAAGNPMAAILAAMSSAGHNMPGGVPNVVQ